MHDYKDYEEAPPFEKIRTKKHQESKDIRECERLKNKVKDHRRNGKRLKPNNRFNLTLRAG